MSLSDVILVFGDDGKVHNVGKAENDLFSDDVYKAMAEMLKASYAPLPQYSWMGKIGDPVPKRTKAPKSEAEGLSAIEKQLEALQAEMPVTEADFYHRSGWPMGQMYMYADAAQHVFDESKAFVKKPGPLSLSVNGLALEGIEKIDWENVAGGVSAKVKLTPEGYDKAMKWLHPIQGPVTVSTFIDEFKTKKETP